jgi:drug/metabolite transporter (DMT)-like permease
VAAIGMSFTNFLTAASSKQISPLMAIWVPWVIFAVLSLFFIWKREGLGKFARNAVKFKRLVLAEGIFDTMAWLFFAFAVFHAKLSVTIAITESWPVIAIFLGLLINRERIGLHQYFGAGIALGASILLGFIL